jgi:hypothetical protein
MPPTAKLKSTPELIADQLLALEVAQAKLDSAAAAIRKALKNLRAIDKASKAPAA